MTWVSAAGFVANDHSGDEMQVDNSKYYSSRTKQNSNDDKNQYVTAPNNGEQDEEAFTLIDSSIKPS